MPWGLGFSEWSGMVLLYLAYLYRIFHKQIWLEGSARH